MSNEKQEKDNAAGSLLEPVVITYWDFLKELHETCHFMSRERTGKATNSELKRWLQNKAVEINGVRPKWDEVVDFPITQMVLFPKKNRITLM